jgi:hypothetical protein
MGLFSITNAVSIAMLRTVFEVHLEN